MRRFALPLACLLGLAASAAADPVLKLAAAFPVEGKEQVVRLEDFGAPTAIRLKIVYRPNSETQSEVIVGDFGADGTVIWRPAVPGITLLIAETHDGQSVCQKRVATCFATTPISGILVMVLAGILLFGGAATSLVLALGGKREPAAN